MYMYIYIYIYIYIHINIYVYPHVWPEADKVVVAVGQAAHGWRV